MITPFLDITLISIALSLLISVLYRVLTKPGEVRKAKQDMKFYKEKMNEAQKEGNKEKSKDYANEMLKASQLQMKYSMRPMIATLVIFFLLLGWLNSNYGSIAVDLKANPDAAFKYGGSSHRVYYEKASEGMKAGVDMNDDGSFSQDEMFKNGDVFGYNGALWRVGPVTEGMFFSSAEKENAVNFEMLVARMPFTVPFIGNYLTWFWWYIFISIPATMVFRKMLGVE